MRSALLCCLLVEADRRRLAAYNYLQIDKLTATDAAASDEFGRSVAIDGDTVVVGADQDDSECGSAYIFRTSDGGASYVEVAKLTASDTTTLDSFGISVAIGGNAIVVGAYGDDDAGSWSGSAYVFRTTDGGATYVEVAKLTAADAASGDYFGGSVATWSGRIVVVGASQYMNSGPGAAYIFRTSDGGATYAQVVKLTASDGAAGDSFGRSVAIDGDTIVIGATGDDDVRRLPIGLGLRLPYDRRLEHVHRYQADGRRRRIVRLLRRIRGDVVGAHRRGRGKSVHEQRPGRSLHLPDERRRRHVRPGGQADGLRWRGGRLLRPLRGHRRGHHRDWGYRRRRRPPASNRARPTSSLRPTTGTRTQISS